MDDRGLPTPVRDVVFNLDVILTTLMHQQGPEIELEFEPNSPDELNFVNNVATPVIIQLLNNDVMPVIPTCTFPRGESGADYGLAEGSFIDGGVTVSEALENNMPDPVEVARKAIVLALQDTALPPEIDIDAVINEALEPARGVLTRTDMTSDDVMQEISMIIRGIETTVNTWTGAVSSEEKQEIEAMGYESTGLSPMDDLSGDHLL